MVARQTAGRGQQVIIGFEIRQILHNRYAFCQYRSVIKLQRRDLTFRVDLPVIFALFR